MKIYCDGGAIVGKNIGACAFVVVENGKTVARFVRLLKDATNNIAEYEGLLDAISFALRYFPTKKITFLLDSELVVKQVSGEYKVKSRHLQPLHEKVTSSLKKEWKVSHIPRSLNRKADEMVKSILKECH